MVTEYERTFSITVNKIIMKIIEVWLLPALPPHPAPDTEWVFTVGFRESVLMFLDFHVVPVLFII